MKNIARLQAKIMALYDQMYGFVPTFGSLEDWNDPNWLARMYDDLYRTYNSLPDEIEMW